MKKLIISIGLMISSQSMAENQECLKGDNSDASLIRGLEFNQKINFCEGYGYVRKVPGGLLYVIIQSRSSYISANVPSVAVSSTFVPCSPCDKR